MKNSIKYLGAVIIAALLSFTMQDTFAQHRGGGGGFHGGGGGGSRSGGGFGGGFHGSPGGGSFNRGSVQGGHEFHGGQRPGSTFQSQPRVNTQSYNRGSYNAAPRSYNGSWRVHATPNYAYRGGQFGYGRSYYNHGVYFRGGYHYYGGYYNRFYAPRLGLRINVLPYGYYPFYWGDDQFYYNNGLFYQQYDNTQYEVVAPPMGAIVPTVPNDAKSITIDGVQYYESNGVYYEPVTTSDGTTGYKIVGKDGELNTDQGDGYDQQQNDNNPPPQGNDQN